MNEIPFFMIALIPLVIIFAMIGFIGVAMSVSDFFDQRAYKKYIDRYKREGGK